MHMIFTEEEKEWINLNKFGWSTKPKCPKNIKDSINKKKKIINSQVNRKAADYIGRR